MAKIEMPIDVQADNNWTREEYYEFILENGLLEFTNFKVPEAWGKEDEEEYEANKMPGMTSDASLNPECLQGAGDGLPTGNVRGSDSQQVLACGKARLAPGRRGH